RMLTEEGSGVRRLLTPGHWDPGPLLTELAAAEAPGLIAPHVVTFNALEESAAWWARHREKPQDARPRRRGLRPPSQQRARVHVSSRPLWQDRRHEPGSREENQRMDAAPSPKDSP